MKKQILVLLAVVVGYGASGSVFGIDKLDYSARVEPVAAPASYVISETD